MKPGLGRMGRPRPWAWLWRRPWLWLSVLLHLGALAALWALGPHAVARATFKPNASQQARLDASLEKARRLQMQRHVRQLDEVLRQLTANAPPKPSSAASPDDPQVLLSQAQRLSDAIVAAEQKQRATELARLLKLKPEQALARIKADDAAKPQPRADLPPAARVEQMAQLAQAALARQQQLALQHEQGTPLAQPGPASQGNKAADGQSQSQGGGVAGSGGAGSVLAGGALDGGGGFADIRRYGPQLKAPAVDSQGLHAGAGRRLGAGGTGGEGSGATQANRIFLDSWYIAGPFEGHSAASLHTRYAPELGVDLDAVYAGKGGRVLEWNYQSSARYPHVPQPRVENAVYYAYTEVFVDTAQAVWLNIGADDDSKLWLNDELVWVSGSETKPWYQQPFYALTTELAQLNLVEARRRVQLKAGRNTLLFKLYNGIDLMFFSVVLTP